MPNEAVEHYAAGAARFTADVRHGEDKAMSNWEECARLTAVVFAPLEERFGFNRLPPSEPFIHYDSSRLRVSIFFDTTRGCELDLGIMRKRDVGTAKPSYGLSALLALHDPDEWASYRSATPPNTAALQAALEKMKNLLLKHGTSLLSGNETDLDDSDRLDREIEGELAKHKAPYMDTVRQVVLKHHRRA